MHPRQITPRDGAFGIQDPPFISLSTDPPTRLAHTWARRDGKLRYGYNCGNKGIRE